MDEKQTFLKSVLSLVPTEKDTYRADFVWKEGTGRSTFGGLLTTQGIKAANHSVPSQYNVHSVHCYYIKPGLAAYPIFYQVERLRDGATIITRIIRAVQKGAVIMYMMASFHRNEKSELSYQYPMPDVPLPEKLETFDQLKVQHHRKLEKEELIGLGQSPAGEMLPFEMRPVHPDLFTHWKINPSSSMTPHKPHQMFWIKFRDSSASDDPKHYEYVASILSEWGPMYGAFYPFPTLRVTLGTSLDHSVCFHRKFDPNQWLLYDCDSSTNENARAYMTGRLWTVDGVLVASFTQEALIRGFLKAKI